MVGRIALYSHDTVGLGHIRRNLLIAHVLSNSEEAPAVLMISGTRAALEFPLPPRADCVTLPGLKKQPDGRYASRRLALDLRTLTHLRSAISQAALDAFDPDLLIVDNVPAGANGELLASLARARQRGTRVVLGLRDVLDAPERVRHEWQRAANEKVIRDYYTEVWVYGDQSVYDIAREYGLSNDVASKLRYTGYLNQQARVERNETCATPDAFGLGSDPYALCVVGGGEDGVHLAEAFARASAPHGARRVILAGPFMAAESRRALEAHAEGDPALIVRGFVPEPGRLMAQAACVVAMGGYNTVCEVLSYNKRALIVPRIRPRVEQWIRAVCLQRLGRMDVMSPAIVTAERLTDWLGVNFDRPLSENSVVDLDGISRVAQFAAQLAAPARRSRSHHLARRDDVA